MSEIKEIYLLSLSSSLGKCEYHRQVFDVRCVVAVQLIEPDICYTLDVRPLDDHPRPERKVYASDLLKPSDNSFSHNDDGLHFSVYHTASQFRDAWHMLNGYAKGIALRQSFAAQTLLDGIQTRARPLDA